MTTFSTQSPDDADVLVSMLLDPPFVRDPYPVASRLREIAPVHRTSRGFWLVSDGPPRSNNCTVRPRCA